MMSKFKTNKSSPNAQKLRGGYYTPSILADFLGEWAIRDGNEKVLEPSYGDGNFLIAAASRLSKFGSITAIEIVKEEIRKAKTKTNNESADISFKCEDFFEAVPGLIGKEEFDVVVGNPPFIRFQYFEKNAREKAFGLLRNLGHSPNGLANAWCAFIQLSVELLREGGRLAMVVPAELLQVQYSAQLRDRLPFLFDDILIIAFDEFVFPDIQQEVVLLLAEGRNRKRSTHVKLHTLQLQNGLKIFKNKDFTKKVSHLPERHTRSGMKWTSLFLDSNQFDLLNRLEQAD